MDNDIDCKVAGDGITDDTNAVQAGCLLRGWTKEYKMAEKHTAGFDKDTANYVIKKKPDMYRLSTRFLFLPRKIQGKIYWLRSVPILEIKHTYRYSNTEIYFSWDILEWYAP